MPSGGGEPIDLSPQLAPYASEDIAFSRYGGRVAFITASDDRLAVRVAVIDDDGRVGELQTVHHSAAALTTLAAERGRDDRGVRVRPSLDRASSTACSPPTPCAASPGPELWDGEGTSIVVHAFAPGRDDHRLLATTNASGRERAFVWDAASGERRDLPADAPGGDIVALDWSPDGREVLLCRIDQARAAVADLEPRRRTTSACSTTRSAPCWATSGCMASYFRPGRRARSCAAGRTSPATAADRP